MSSHPNAILLLVLKPDDGSRKTHRAICAEIDISPDRDTDNIKIGEHEYHHLVMESAYDDGFQISADEGDIVIFDMVTYGYGDRIAWEDLVAQKAELDAWSKGICERHRCAASVFITQNYW